MWWHSWEMWGRGRFRRIPKSKQKARKRRGLYSDLSDSKINIVADPVDLNSIFNNPRTAKKLYRRLPQPGTPSPSDSDRVRETHHEDGDEEEVGQLEAAPDFAVINDPFKVAWVDNFIKDQQFLEELISFVANGPYEERDNDLFTYRQMNDEIFMSHPLTQRLLTSLVTCVLPFMSNVVGSELKSEKVSLSASKYYYTDHLLVHDDMTGDRRIAFIIYLNKNWKRSWGGTLDLFRRDHLNLPGPIATRLVPKFNRMIFFEVTPFSFHQVSEVLKDGPERISVNGWFHYPTPTRDNEN